MPEIILLEIFAHLSISDRFSASSTCKRWRGVLFHPNNWSSKLFNFDQRDIQREIFLSSRIGHFVKECTIKFCDKLHFLPLFNVSDSSRGAEVIKLLQRLSTNKRLKRLTLNQLPFDHGYTQLANDQIFYGLENGRMESISSNSNFRRVTRSCTKKLQDSERNSIFMYDSKRCHERMR